MGNYETTSCLMCAVQDLFLLVSFTNDYCSCNFVWHVTRRVNAPLFSCVKDVIVGVSGEFMVGWVKAVTLLGSMAYVVGY